MCVHTHTPLCVFHLKGGSMKPEFIIGSCLYCMKDKLVWQTKPFPYVNNSPNKITFLLLIIAFIHKNCYIDLFGMAESVYCCNLIQHLEFDIWVLPSVGKKGFK